MSQILLTGASGFIGKNLLNHQRFKKAICTGTTNPLTGLGSIIFRNEENLMTGISENTLFYNDYIAPYKGSLRFGMWRIKVYIYISN